MHALEPISNEFDVTIQTFADTGQGYPVSAANALIKLWLIAGQDSAPADLVAAYTTCLRIAMHAFSPLDADIRDKYYTLILRQLAVDCSRIPASLLNGMIEGIRATDQTGDDFYYRVTAVLDKNTPPGK